MKPTYRIKDPVKPTLKEFESSAPVSAWLESRGLTVYSELPWMNRLVDLVGAAGERRVAVELKVTLSYTLLLQCLPLQVATREVFAAVSCQPTQKSVYIFVHYGLGVLQVSNDRVTVLVEPNSLYEPSCEFALSVEGCEPGGIAGLPHPAPEQFQSQVRKHKRSTGPCQWFGIYTMLRDFYARYRPA